MVKTFLTRGSAAALGAFIPGIRSAILLGILLAFYGENVQSTVGLTGAYFGVAFVATAGFTVSAVFRFANHSEEPVFSMRSAFVDEFRIGTAALVVLGVFAVAAGLVLPFLIEIDPVLFQAFWFISIGSTLILPFSATLIGVFQARNRDVENLVVNLSAMLIQLAVTLTIAINGASPLLAVVVIALVGVICDWTAFLYRAIRLEPASPIIFLLVLQGIKCFLQRPREALSLFPDRTKGALDGLILMSVFSVACTVAAGNSPRDGAIVVTVVAILRSLVIPLKQYGMVGGRLIKQREFLGENPIVHFRVLLHVSMVLLLILGATLLILRWFTPVVSAIPWPLIVLMIVQLCLEPITGFAFGAQKILSTPAFGLRALAAISIVGTIPGLLLVSAAGLGSAENVWVVVFCARVIFFGVVAIKLTRWARQKRNEYA